MEEELRREWEYLITKSGLDVHNFNIRDFFAAGFTAAWNSAYQKAWEDGYTHGFDDGRYKTIEEGC